jgi:hypothetical protein
MISWTAAAVRFTPLRGRQKTGAEASHADIAHRPHLRQTNEGNHELSNRRYRDRPFVDRTNVDGARRAYVRGRTLAFTRVLRLYSSNRQHCVRSAVTKYRIQR